MEDRGQKYGDFGVSMQAAAECLHALLMMHYQDRTLPPIPPHVVAQFMVTVKATRACAPFQFEPDNYLDGHNYLDIAMKCDDRNPDNAPKLDLGL